MLVPFSFACPVCGQEIESAADPSQGTSQRYIEDCHVCCRPLVLHVEIDGDRSVAFAEPE